MIKLYFSYIICSSSKDLGSDLPKPLECFKFESIKDAFCYMNDLDLIAIIDKGWLPGGSTLCLEVWNFRLIPLSAPREKGEVKVKSITSGQIII